MPPVVLTHESVSSLYGTYQDLTLLCVWFLASQLECTLQEKKACLVHCCVSFPGQCWLLVNTWPVCSLWMNELEAGLQSPLILTDNRNFHLLSYVICGIEIMSTSQNYSRLCGKCLSLANFWYMLVCWSHKLHLLELTNPETFTWIKCPQLRSIFESPRENI